MAEPSRKKIKGRVGPIVEPVNKDGQTDPLYFVTGHPTKPCIVDLRVFASGTSGVSRRHQLPFSGRPSLIGELAPVLRALTLKAPLHTVDWHIKALRTYWRFFDRHEAHGMVRKTEDITDLHGALQRRDAVRGSMTSAFLKLLNVARRLRQLPPLYWTKNKDESRIVDIPVREHVALVHSELKHLVLATRERFALCDALAKQGRVLLNARADVKTSALTEGEMHATYRVWLVGQKQTIMNPALLRESNFIDKSVIDAVPDLAHGLYPSIADVQAAFLLFVLKSGWNAGTALDIDVTGPYVIPHPTAAGYHIVRSTKNRGNSIQYSMGQNKSEFSPKAIIQNIVERTQPLRKNLVKQLNYLLEFERLHPSDHHVRLKIAALERKVKSPWLFVNVGKRGEPVQALGEYNYDRSLSLQDGRKLIRSLIGRLNRRLKAANSLAKEQNQDVRDYKPIDLSLSVSDLRDAFAAYSYESSGYNWLMVKLALGHKRPESTKTYLRKREYKSQGEKTIRTLTNALLNDIEQHRLVEPAFLFFQMEHGAISPEQRARYFKDTKRTRVGTGCADFTRPPKEIAPRHIEGRGCRVQRCTLCRHAVIFVDSIRLLARRLAELDAIRTNIPALTWTQTSFGEDRANTDAALGRFDQAEVKLQLNYWTREIAEGRHRPLDFEGTYE